MKGQNDVTTERMFLFSLWGEQRQWTSAEPQFFVYKLLLILCVSEHFNQKLFHICIFL